MIQTKLDDLIRQKEYDEKRRLPLRTIAAEAGLAIGTVQRLRRGDTSRIYLSTLDTLCGYFGLSDIGEMLEYVPGEKSE